jgi:hypothetical protein
MNWLRVVTLGTGEQGDAVLKLPALEFGLQAVLRQPYTKRTVATWRDEVTVTPGYLGTPSQKPIQAGG